MTKREKFLNWLFSGVVNDIISEPRAKQLYIEKYGYIGHREFQHLLYEDR